MCEPRYKGNMPKDMLPIGTKSSIIVYAPDREEKEDYLVFEGEITNRFPNNVQWNYQHSSSPHIPAKKGDRGGSYLGTYGHKTSWDGDNEHHKLMRKLNKIAGYDVYTLYINDWGTDHRVPGIQHIYILTILPVDQGIAKLKEIVREYKFYKCSEEMKKIKEAYGSQS